MGYPRWSKMSQPQVVLRKMNFHCFFGGLFPAGPPARIFCMVLKRQQCPLHPLRPSSSITWWSFPKILQHLLLISFIFARLTQYAIVTFQIQLNVWPNRPDSWILFYAIDASFLIRQVLKQIEETEALSKKQDDEDVMYSQVKSDFKSSSDELESVRPQASAVIEIGKRTSTEVGQLGRDIEALLNKMKELKDKISRFELCITCPYVSLIGHGLVKMQSFSHY